MRQRTGIAGATLIYGPQPEPPDLLLASQFLIDDLRRDGRTISGVRISRHALRLRADGFELALSLTDAPLPMHAFAGTVRPLPDSAGTPDMARGRVLHALRHHRWVLGLLMRLRGVQEGQSMDTRLQALPGACHALIDAVAEAAPPMLVIWQSSGVVCTASEFMHLPADLLENPAGACSPLYQTGAPRRPLVRPASARLAPVTPRRALPGQAGDEAFGTTASGDAAAQPAAPGLPSPPDRVSAGAVLPAAAAPRAVGGAPDSRAARVSRQSGGRLFGRRAQTGRVAVAASPGLAGHNDRLARALRHDRPAIDKGATTTPAAQAPRPAGGAALRIGLLCLALVIIGPSAAETEAGSIILALQP